MKFRNLAHIAAWLVLGVVLLAAASCGGGSDTTTGPGGGTIGTGDNEVPPLDIPGGTQYPGKDNPSPPDPPDPGNPPPIPPHGPFEFGANIFSIPVDTNGVGRVVANSFSPGQKVAFVVVNMNPNFFDAHADGSTGAFPILPESNYSLQADLTIKGGSSMPRPEEVQQATLADLGSPHYSGMPWTGELQDSDAIYERESLASGVQPYSVPEGIKSVSTIQKGEIRTFTNTPPRLGTPPIPPGPDDPDRNTDDFMYPFPYNSQDGRLVAIGAHCLIFLSTDINEGHPDNIQFTQARLNRMAKEFDTVIFPIDTASFGPVVSYAEGSVFKNVDRSIALTGDDYDIDGNIQTEMPFEVDNEIINEQKILIFIHDGDAGGFFTFGPAVDENDVEKPVGSTLYIGSDNFPPNDGVWDATFSVMAHEFQHKLYHDHGLPIRQTSYGWFNEGLSMLAIHLCGYSVNSGRIVPWAIDGQVTEYLNNCNQAAVPMDANPYFSNQAQYGSGFLFFLYMYEHYDPGVGKRIYAAAKQNLGTTDFAALISAGAQTTSTAIGPDGIANTADDNPDLYGADALAGTADDTSIKTHDTFDQVYAKWCIANFIDGIYKGNESALSDPRFIYNTIDLRGTVNLATGTIVLPGVKTSVFPGGGSYPVISNDRLVFPWCADYTVFGNGTGQDLEVTMVGDRNMKMFMMPVTYNPATNSVDVSTDITLPY